MLVIFTRFVWIENEALRYQEYICNIRAEIRKTEEFTSKLEEQDHGRYAFQNTQVVVLQTRNGFGWAIRTALLEHVSTP